MRSNDQTIMRLLWPVESNQVSESLSPNSHMNSRVTRALSRWRSLFPSYVTSTVRGHKFFEFSQLRAELQDDYLRRAKKKPGRMPEKMAAEKVSRGDLAVIWGSAVCDSSWLFVNGAGHVNRRGNYEEDIAGTIRRTVVHHSLTDLITFHSSHQHVGPTTATFMCPHRHHRRHRRRHRCSHRLTNSHGCPVRLSSHRITLSPVVLSSEHHQRDTTTLLMR